MDINGFMQTERDPYYSRSEISNSDLSNLEKFLYPPRVELDPTEAYAFGTLLDACITEPAKVDYYKFTCAGHQHTRQDFEQAEAMKKAFYRDPLCKILAENSEFQKISIDHRFEINWEGTKFRLPVRCKFDLYAKPRIKMTGDIKSTACTTEKQFIEAIRYFNYDRQASWYMDIENIDHNVIIGISKENHKVFKVAVKRGDEMYRAGKDKYSFLAFMYWTLFHFQSQHDHAGIPAANTI